MLYLTCTSITSVDLAHDGVSRVKDWVSVDCGTMFNKHMSSDIFPAHSHCSTHVLEPM